MNVESYDIVVLGGTPGGIMAAIAAAREGRRSVVLERTSHCGGLPANGLGATDIATRGATEGLFTEFTNRVRNHYVAKYGPTSKQVEDCSNGYHFEPHVAELVLLEMVAAEGDRVVVKLRRQFDVDARNVTRDRTSIKEIRVTHLDGTSSTERYAGRVFIDATYEGDLAAAAGVPYLLGREGREETGEEMAGRIYRSWPHETPGEGSTGLGDNAIQAYNYRLCLTNDPKNRLQIERPLNYNRADFASLVDDVIHDRVAGHKGGERAFDGLGRVVNFVRLPNEKTDANNQHMAFLSTDLPEENWPWPTSDWAWRDAFAKRLRDYTLGLLWFAQNDDALPADFRQRCREWGLAVDEYGDNGHFPRQVYVREGRRIEGEYRFSAHDCVPATPGGRPPIHADSITASHYAIDSHAVRKREPGRAHLDGFLSYPTKPYTVPYRAIVPKRIDNLLTPVPVSATHIGFGTLRMEPCWMALGQAAGVAASVAIETNRANRAIDVAELQRRLIAQGAVLVYFKDSKPGDAGNAELQKQALASGGTEVAWTKA